LPASLSAPVMRDLIRNELKYQGIIVAGRWDAGDIKRQRDPAQAALMALAAGADMLYWGASGQPVLKGVETIARAVEGGSLDRAVVQSACDRVIKLKKDRDLLSRELPSKKKADALGTKAAIRMRRMKSSGVRSRSCRIGTTCCRSRKTLPFRWA